MQVMQDHSTAESLDFRERHPWHCKAKGGLMSVQTLQDHSPEGAFRGLVEFSVDGGRGGDAAVFLPAL